METVLSGIRPTGQLHLGNYFGALRNFTKMQHTDRCFFFIADYHALTTHPDPTSLHGNVRNILAEYLAAGLDPQVATIYVQSDVPETRLLRPKTKKKMRKLMQKQKNYFPIRITRMRIMLLLP